MYLEEIVFVPNHEVEAYASVLLSAQGRADTKGKCCTNIKTIDELVTVSLNLFKFK